MKTILNITALSFIFCSLILNAQDNQKWYADDIYYSSNEKDVNYLEIIFEEEGEYYEDSDSIEEYYEDNMSYSMRISRFHRDYYGSSVNFNYGYFHDPYGFDNGFGCMPSYQPYFQNNWYGGYYGYNNFYNPWNSPWNNNFYAWNPYGNNSFGYNYGCGFGGYGYGGYGNSPYNFNTPFVYSTNTTYGHRESLGNNIITKKSSTGDVVGGARSTDLVKKTSTTINRNDYTTSTNKTSYKPKQTRRTYNYKPTKSTKTTKRTRIKGSTKPSNSRTKKTSYKKSSSRSNTSYTPSRSSNTNRSTNTNRSSSTPSRRPR